MGMFDWIEWECKCPGCGAKVDGFQSKSAGCSLATLKPWEVEKFYTSCDKCNLWIEYSLENEDDLPKRIPPPEPPGWLDKYYMKTRQLRTLNVEQPTDSKE